MMEQQTHQTVYSGNNSSRIVFPLGGIGSGMIGLEGTGAYH